MHAVLVRIGALLLLLGVGVWAQEQPKRVWHSVFCPVGAVAAPAGRVQRVMLLRGLKQGVVKGRRGAVHSVTQGGKKSVEIIGNAEVEDADAMTARVRVTLADPGRPCKPGDLIELDCLVSARERTILWRLAQYDIRLRNEMKEHRYYSFETIVNEDAPAATRALLAYMLVRIRMSGREHADLAPLQRILAAGRYKGRKVADIMAGATDDELGDFFRFVLSYPGKYMGHTWRIDEVFATWVISGAPYSKIELADALVAAKSDTRRRELLAVDPSLRADTLSELLRRARAFGNERKFDPARSLLVLVSGLRRPVDDPRIALELQFSRGKLLKQTDEWRNAASQFAQTLDDCGRAQPLPAAARWVESAAYLQLGHALKKLGNHQGALAAYKNGARVQKANGAGLEARAQTTRTIADLLRDQGDFNAAIKAYAEAIDQFRELDARAQLNDSLAGRAEAAGKLGRASEAIRVYRVLAREYREAGNEAKVAETLQSIGEQHAARGAQMQAAVEFDKALEIWKRLGSLSGMTNVRESLSMAYANIGNYKEASRLNALVLDGYKKQKARSSELIAEADRGWLQTGLGDYRGGLEIAENALARLEDMDYAYGVMFVRNRIGLVRQQHYEYEAARKLYSKTSDEARIAKDHGMLTDALRRRASVSAKLRDFDAARKDLDSAYAIARDTGAPGSLARIRLQLAHTELARRDFSAAHAAADEVIRLSREIGNLSSEAHGHRVKGLAWSAQYDSKRAEACFQEAFRLFADPNIRDAEETARTMLYLAGEYHEQGLWEQAERTAQQARTTAGENLAVDAMREGEMMLARMKRIRGELREALAAFEKIAEDPRLRDWEKPDLWLETAKLAHLLGTGELALEYIHKAQKLALDQRNDWVASAAGIELSRILLSQGDYDAAMREVEKTRPFSARTADLDHIAALEATAGDIALARKDLDAAAAHLERAYATAARMSSPTLLSTYVLKLGKCRREQGRGEDAKRLLTEAAEIFARMKSVTWESESRLELARLALSRHDLEEAGNQLRRVEKIAASTAATEVIWQYWFVRSQLDEQRGKLDEAMASRKRAVLHLSKTSRGLGADPERQRKFLLGKVEVYESMAELIGKRIEGASDDAERVKLVEELASFVDRARFEVLRSGAEQTGSKVVDKLLDEIRRLGRRSDAIKKQLAKARERGLKELENKLAEVLARNEQELGRLFDDLHAKDPDFGSRMKFNPKYFRNWRRLPENARLVIYFPAPDGLHFMVYGKTGFLVWKKNKKATEAKLRALVLKFHDLLGDVARQSVEERGSGFGPAAEANENNPDWYRRNCAETYAVLRQLNDWVIAPVKEHIVDAEPLILMPYASLCYLPFEAVVAPDGSFLGERHTVSYLIHRDHMRDTLGGLRDPPHRGEDHWIAFGDPVGKLKSALSEVTEIAAKFKRHTVHTQKSGTATEKQLFETPEDCTILHFATHGYLNGAKPSNTYLELAPSDPYDGKLEQGEIWPTLGNELTCLQNGKLRLIVLSACDTARGSKDPKAEVLGLPDSFTAVGAPAVIASLWRVDTWSTGNLMAEFYDRLCGEKNMGIGLALRGAREALVKDKGNARYAHPYYWAPFVLFGDWR